MIRLANENLIKFSNIEFIKIDISQLEIAEKVDVVFSNATLHWILNHKFLNTSGKF
jgi:trans-aconitate methyltransferase